MENKIPIIIDTDPGIDDAVALAIALNHPLLDVCLITTVAGNIGLDKTTMNALKLTTFFKKDVLVAKGSAHSLFGETNDAINIHGESGMDGYDFKEVSYKNLSDDKAINMMYKVIMRNEGITIVSIGPLTNVALLFCVYPEVKTRIGQVVLMGGSTGRGNKGVMSEFNVFCDPEAAKIVFKSGVKIVVCPLDVGLKALVYPEDSLKIKGLNKTGEMIYSLFQHYRSFGLKNGLKMYDSCAIAYLTDPSMFSIVHTYVDIETSFTLTRGCSIVDLKNYLQKENNARVCVDINQEQFREWLITSLKNCI